MPFEVRVNRENPSDIQLHSKWWGTTGFRLPADGTAASKLIQPMIDVAHMIDNRCGEAALDQTLTAEGKAQRIAKPLAEALAAIDKQQGNLDAMVADRKQLEATFTTPPPCEDAAADREIRSTYAALSEAQRMAVDAQMRQGAADPVLHALMRSPIAAALPAAVPAIWKARVERLHGVRLDDFAARAEQESRAQGAIDAMRHLLRRRPFAQ